MAALITVSIINIREGNFGVISYVLCFLWGLQDGIVNTHCFQILGYEFETFGGDQYSIFQFVQGISVSIFQASESSIDDADHPNTALLNYTYFISVFGMVAIAYTFTFDFKKKIK